MPPSSSLIIKKGLCTSQVCRTIIDLCRSSGIEIIVDPKGSHWQKYKNTTCITPNFTEFCAVAGDVSNDDTTIIEKASAICAELDLEHLLVTRGAKGMVMAGPGKKPLFLSARAKEVYDVSGAGDTVIACLAACRNLNWPWENAVECANLAAGIVVAKSGTKPVSIEDLTAGKKDATSRKIQTVEMAQKPLGNWQSEGQKIGFTNGCFDILHPGHIHLLNAAAEQCDKLIVGLNSDASVTRLKGPERPILHQDERTALIAALKAVDMVIIFEEDTPYALIKRIQPAILIKGSDYKKEDVVGADLVESYGGRVVLVDLMENKSTSSIIDRIKTLNHNENK